jgi:hypothetical protein
VTFAVGHVEGGTHAGWRKVREKPKAWLHPCGPCDAHTPVEFRELPGYLTRCPDCKTERP